MIATQGSCPGLFSDDPPGLTPDRKRRLSIEQPFVIFEGINLIPEFTKLSGDRKIVGADSGTETIPIVSRKDFSVFWETSSTSGRLHLARRGIHCSTHPR